MVFYPRKMIQDRVSTNLFLLVQKIKLALAKNRKVLKFIKIFSGATCIGSVRYRKVLFLKEYLCHVFTRKRDHFFQFPPVGVNEVYSFSSKHMVIFYLCAELFDPTLFKSLWKHISSNSLKLKSLLNRPQSMNLWFV